MAGRGERDRAKQVQERCQRLLTELLRDDDNKYCVDCDAKGPRWASWNLGIFLCIRCAGIHRNLGVHISKVKSVNLDSWTPEQVVSLQQMGNSRARAVYEANIPDSFRRPQTDSALEAFVRAKYEHRKYVAREWVPPSPPQVNWDKEIDEEMEKQKKKKKSTSSSLSSSSTSSTEKKSSKQSNVMPKLPKPKSSASPKPGRSTPKRDSGGTADLLGTTKASADASSHNNLTDDVFSSFLSAPQAPPQDTNKNTTETVKVDDLKSEEESFFNQPAPSEKEKSKMTKDSILALYGQAPMKNVAQFAPSNGFVTAFPQQPYQQAGQINAFSQGFANFPAQAQFVQNGAMPTANPVQPQGFTSGFSQFGGAPAPAPFNNQFNQFQNMQSFQQPLAANNQFQGSPQFQNSNLNGVFPPTAAANGSQAFVPASGNNLSQQFGGMSLGQNNAIPPAMNAAFPNQPSNLTGAFPSTTQQPNIAANGVWP